MEHLPTTRYAQDEGLSHNEGYDTQFANRMGFTFGTRRISPFSVDWVYAVLGHFSAGKAKEEPSPATSRE